MNNTGNEVEVKTHINDIEDLFNKTGRIGLFQKRNYEPRREAGMDVADNHLGHCFYRYRRQIDRSMRGRFISQIAERRSNNDKMTWT